MKIKELIKKLKKYPNDYLVRVRIDTSFMEMLKEYVDDKTKKPIKIPKKYIDIIKDNLGCPNYWIEEIENTSVDCGREITLWGEY
jgi:hypothetical protein